VIKDVKRDDIEELEERIKWLESDLDFQISENERLEAKVKRYQDSIRNSYYYINDTLHKKVNRPDYKAIIKLEWMLPWEDNQ
jgi:guanylate kinase